MNEKDKPNPPVPPAPKPTLESNPDTVYRDRSTKAEQKEKIEKQKTKIHK